jgi:hypothetical protein
MEDQENEEESADDKFWEEAKEGVDYFIDKDGMRCDIKERDPKFRSIIKKADKEAEENLSKENGGKLPEWLGTCHSIWGEQKRILKEKYNIDWKTPAEMNPDVQFD